MLYLSFICQGLIMLIDEFIIHERRGLPKWERYGHPLDSFSVLAALMYLLNFPWSPANQNVYLGLCIFSCLFITKDEFVHQKESTGIEHWLHSLLFLLHPVTFWCAGIIWKENPENPFLLIQTIVIATFMVYQILRWSSRWPKSTTTSTKPSGNAGTKPSMIRSHSFVRKIISSSRG